MKPLLVMSLWLLFSAPQSLASDTLPRCSIPQADHSLDLFLLAGQSNMLGLGARRDVISRLLPGSLPSDRVLVSGPPLPTATWGPLDFGFGIQNQEQFDYGLPGEQSNSSFGPELGFGLALLQQSDPHPLQAGIIKYSRPRTTLANDWAPAHGTDYRNFLLHTISSINALDRHYMAAVRGIVWMQGESDADAGHEGNENGAYAAAYAENLEAFIIALRNDLFFSQCITDRELPVVLGRISPSPLWRYADEVRQAQLSVAQRLPHVGIVETAQLPLQDGAHYSSWAFLQLGALFAKAFDAQEPYPTAFTDFRDQQFHFITAHRYCRARNRDASKPRFNANHAIPWFARFTGECSNLAH